jgi:hypothetical protein
MIRWFLNDRNERIMANIESGGFMNLFTVISLFLFSSSVLAKDFNVSLSKNSVFADKGTYQGTIEGELSTVELIPTTEEIANKLKAIQILAASTGENQKFVAGGSVIESQTMPARGRVPEYRTTRLLVYKIAE